MNSDGWSSVSYNDSESITFGAVHLAVTDVDQACAFWCGLIGLSLLRREAAAAVLGVEGAELIVVHPGATRRAAPGRTGLYHVALHLPDLGEFGRVLGRLIASGYPAHPTDHVMSKAIYLSDPDGIGLELTLETPELLSDVRVHSWGVEMVDIHGRVSDGRNRLDLDMVLSAVPDSDLARPLPVGTFVGHVHVHVSDLEVASRFYADGLGFLEHERVEHMGMADFHAGGRFKHRMAINTWQGVGAPPPVPGTAGLQFFQVRYDGARRLEAAADRLVDCMEIEEGYTLRDPSGNGIVMTT